MPARIDHVGRAHELKVRYLLKPIKSYQRDLVTVLAKLKRLYPQDYKVHFKRIYVGAVHTASFIKENLIKDKLIGEIDYTGEKNKGISDVDLIIHFMDGSKSSLSLKLYKTKSFNLWNPTLETLLLHLTGKGFSDYLSQKELKKYRREMASLKDRKVESKSIAYFWVKRAADVLTEFNKLSPKIFRKKLVNKLGCASLIIAPIVDKNGLYKELISTHPHLMEQLASGSGDLAVVFNGISISILLDKKPLTSFAIYAQSGSKGRSGGLRIATWTPYA